MADDGLFGVPHANSSGTRPESSPLAGHTWNILFSTIINATRLRDDVPEPAADSGQFPKKQKFCAENRCGFPPAR